MNIDRLEKNLEKFKLASNKIRAIKEFVKDEANIEKFRYLNASDLAAAFYYINKFPAIDKENPDSEKIDKNLDETMEHFDKTRVDKNRILKQKFQIIRYISVILDLGYNPKEKK